MRRTTSSLPSTSHESPAQRLRRHAALLRFAHAALLGCGAAPVLEDALRHFLGELCEYRRWAFSHLRLFSPASAESSGPTDLWHSSRFTPLDPPEQTRAVNLLGSSEERFQPALRSGYACCVEVPAQWGIRLQSCVVVPLISSGRPLGILEFVSEQPDPADPLLLGVLTAIAARLAALVEHRRADHQIHALSARLFHLQDEERRRLARELHDTTGQNVTAMIFDLGAIGRSPTLDKASQAVVEECKTLAQQTLREVRTFSYALHPPMLDELGFAAALGIFVESFSRRSGAKVELKLPKSLPKLPAELETALFRVVQEGLSNAQRYARGSPCEVRMLVDESAIRLAVQNQAAAHLPRPAGAPPLRYAGVGLSAARERVEFFGGKLVLRPESGRTILEASIPRPKPMTQSA